MSGVHYGRNVGNVYLDSLNRSDLALDIYLCETLRWSTWNFSCKNVTTVLKDIALNLKGRVSIQLFRDEGLKKIELIELNIRMTQLCYPITTYEK